LVESIIKKNKLVDDLITKLLIKFKAEGSNILRKPSLFMEQALQLRKIAPFLDINSYLYFLSEMSVLILQLKNGYNVIFYGLDDWGEGLNILNYSIPEDDGFHLIMDICNSEGDTLYFSYNSKTSNKDILWVSSNIDSENELYTKTSMSFIDLLNLIYEENIQFPKLKTS